MKNTSDKTTICDGGKPPKSFTDYIREARMKACLKAIEQDPNLCLWYEDLENLIPCVITHEQRAELMKFWNPEPIDFSKYPTGKLMMFGTGGDMDKSGKSFEDEFKNPNRGENKQQL